MEFDFEGWQSPKYQLSGGFDQRSAAWHLSRLGVTPPPPTPPTADVRYFPLEILP